MDKENDKIICLLREFKKDVNKKVKLDKMILFGSRARGKAKKTSDIDLLFVSKKFKGKKYFKRSPEFYLMWDYDYDVDIICLTPEEVAKKRRETGIINYAINEGIEI